MSWDAKLIVVRRGWGVVELQEMKALVISGSIKKAFEFALGANKTNGLRRMRRSMPCRMRALRRPVIESMLMFF